MQGNAERGAEEEERRRDEGTGEGTKVVAREEERRRNEGTGEGTREVARAAGGEAAGAWVIGDRRMRWKMACYGGNGRDGKVLRCGAGKRHQQQGELAKIAVITNDKCEINSQPNAEGVGWALMHYERGPRGIRH